MGLTFRDHTPTGVVERAYLRITGVRLVRRDLRGGVRYDLSVEHTRHLTDESGKPREVPYSGPALIEVPLTGVENTAAAAAGGGVAGAMLKMAYEAIKSSGQLERVADAP